MQARAADGMCGPEGLLFEPYTVFKRSARWLARANLLTLYALALGTLVGALVIAGTLLGRW
jgi:hypothetical protein